jgi:parallel beta-helix repeat protein
VILDAGLTVPLDVVLQNSDISNNTDIGVAVQGNPSRLRVVGNTIRSNGSIGLLLQENAWLDLQGNTLSGNGEAGIALQLDATLTRLREMNTFSVPEAGTPGADIRILAPENPRP